MLRAALMAHFDRDAVSPRRRSTSATPNSDAARPGCRRARAGSTGRSRPAKRWPASAMPRSSRAPDCRPIRRAEARRRNRTARVCANCASMRFVTPGTRFCSCTISGTCDEPRRDAARARRRSRPCYSTLRGALAHDRRARRRPRARAATARPVARARPCRACR